MVARNEPFCNRLDVWNAKSQSRARAQVWAYAAQHWREDLQRTCVQGGCLRSLGTNVVVGALPPRMVASSMNKWLLRRLRTSRRRNSSSSSSSSSCSWSSNGTDRNSMTATIGDDGGHTSRASTATTTAPLLHFGVVVMDFVDAEVVDELVRLTYSQLNVRQQY